jgi:hypothetical protein
LELDGSGTLLVILVLQSYEERYGNHCWSGRRFSRPAADELGSPNVRQSPRVAQRDTSKEAGSCKAASEAILVTALGRWRLDENTPFLQESTTVQKTI